MEFGRRWSAAARLCDCQHADLHHLTGNALLAIIRTILELAQKAGVIVLAVCLYRYGPGQETIIALSITMGVTKLSIVLFRLVRVQDKAHP